MIGEILAMLLPFLPVSYQEYDINIDVDEQYKVWEYIESEPYKVTLKNNERININLDVKSKWGLDLIEIRFYNICNTGDNPEIGKIFVTVNGNNVLPTIGEQNIEYPVYIASPPCDKYGTTQTFLFDTDDSRGQGSFNYSFRYEGQDIKIKTIELYLVRGYVYE